MARAPTSNMFVTQLAGEADVIRLLGEVDPLTTARILAIVPTIAELEEATCEGADESGPGDEPRTPASARVAKIRRVLDEVAAAELDGEPDRGAGAEHLAGHS